MALTLLQGSYLTNDVLLSGVIQTIVTESDVLKVLPFNTVVGNGFTYNRESTQPTATFVAVNGIVPESTGTVTQVTIALKILLMDSDLDVFIRDTMSDISDQEAIQLAAAAKAIAYKYDTTFIYGNTTTDAEAFNGLHALMPSGQKIHQGSSTTGAALSMNNLDALVDSVKPGRPDALIMNKTMRRRIKQFYRSTNSYSFEMTPGDDGKPIETYGGIRIILDDFINMTETISGDDYALPTTGATTSIFAVKWGDTDVCGLQNGSITTREIGLLESKNAVRNRIYWFCSLMLGSTLALGRIDGITNAACVA